MPNAYLLDTQLTWGRPLYNGPNGVSVKHHGWWILEYRQPSDHLTSTTLWHIVFEKVQGLCNIDPPEVLLHCYRNGLPFRIFDRGGPSNPDDFYRKNGCYPTDVPLVRLVDTTNKNKPTPVSFGSSWMTRWADVDYARGLWEDLMANGFTVCCSSPITVPSVVPKPTEVFKLQSDLEFFNYWTEELEDLRSLTISHLNTLARNAPVTSGGPNSIQQVMEILKKGIDHTQTENYALGA